MSYQENRTLAYLISSLLGVGLYSFLVVQRSWAGGLEATTISSAWGSTILIVIAVQIVLSILFSILITIIQAIRTREEQPDLADERDQLIDLRANRLSYAVFGVGFVGAMAALAAGLPPVVMLHLIVYSLFGAWIVGYIAQLYLYRRGF